MQQTCAGDVCCSPPRKTSAAAPRQQRAPPELSKTCSKTCSRARARVSACKGEREARSHLPRVRGVGDAEAKIEVEGLDQLVLEVVALNHPEVLDGVWADGELQPACIYICMYVFGGWLGPTENCSLQEQEALDERAREQGNEGVRERGSKGARERRSEGTSAARESTHARGKTGRSSRQHASCAECSSAVRLKSRP